MARPQSPLYLDGEQPLLSGSQKQEVNTMAAWADEVPYRPPADRFEKALRHRLDDVSGHAGQRASPRGWSERRQRLIERRFEDGIASANLRFET